MDNPYVVKPPTTFPENVLFWIAVVVILVGIVVLFSITFWPASPSATGGCTDDNTCYIRRPEPTFPIESTR